MFNRIVDKLLKKKWSDYQIKQLVGEYSQLWHAYARNPEIRINAASGGVGTGILIGLLQAGEIDGALVCETRIEDGRVRAHFIIATTPQQIIESQGSKYVETAFLKEALPLIRAFTGQLAVVGLPCDITHLTRWMAKDSELNRKVRVKIALVCSHNSRHGLVDSITLKLEQQANSRITSYRFKKGLWRGELEAKFENGAIIKKPYYHFGMYQNLFFFSEKKCLACHDHFGYNSDISLGDVWAYRFKDDTIKKTGVIIRTDNGSHLWSRVHEQKLIEASPLEINDILDGQTRAAPFHYNVSARSRVAPRFGYKLPDKLGCRVRWHEWLTAWMALSSMRWSESPRWRGWIFKLPRPLLKLYLYFRKGLESL
jgi:coenzyme F420 hydrogenase subunit beta